MYDRQKLSFHYSPKKGWVNDPNGLVFFDGYYHLFYQHAPDSERPDGMVMHWGHARSRDLLQWEELPVALSPDARYDAKGCWSGTAIVREDTIYLFYASITADGRQTVSVACSGDGIHFEKYAQNPVIDGYPADGCPDFRDPAVCCIDGRYYCVMASGHRETETGRLLLYKSEDLLRWEYVGIMCSWEGCRYTECPSFMSTENGLCLLTASVCPLESRHFFSVMYGRFEEGKFTVQCTAEIDKGPDQYAGQVFKDPKNRTILISWIPGWSYIGFAPKDVGCMSVPRELRFDNGRITAFPVEEVRHLLKESDPAVRRTPNGFVIDRQGREPVVYEGRISDLQILRDGYVLEVFVNGGEEVYSVLL